MENNFKIGKYRDSFRRYPDNYSSFTKEEKEACDRAFIDKVRDPNKKYRDIFYYAEIIYPDSEYDDEISEGEKNGETDIKTILNDKNKIFINQSRAVHGDKYDYSKVDYVSAHDKVIINCPIHGDFEQRPTNHISMKQGCRGCGLVERNKIWAEKRLAKGEKIKEEKTKKEKPKKSIKKNKITFDIETSSSLDDSEYSPEFLDFLEMFKK